MKMKKNLITLMLAFAIPLIYYGIVWSADVTAPTSFTMDYPTTTTIRITYSGQAALDSLVLMSADSLVVAVLDSAAAVDTVTALVPGTNYIWKIKAQRATGEQDLSSLDTLRTEYPIVEPSWYDKFKLYARRVVAATAWRITGTQTDSLLVNGTSALDSTMVYRPAPYNSLKIFSYQAGDSVKVMINVYAGERNEKNNTWEFTLVDSVNVSTSGTKVSALNSLPQCEHVYFRAGSYAGNGKNTSLRIYYITSF